MTLPSLPNYDSWKTHNPSEEENPVNEENEERIHPDCTCIPQSFKSRRNCTVHGIDPDAARDEYLDRQQERDY